MYKFRQQKNKAGNETIRLSFNFTRTNNPKNMSSARPPDEIIKIGLKSKPTIRPTAPNNCNTIVSNPNFSSLKRLNSLFIRGSIK